MTVYFVSNLDHTITPVHTPPRTQWNNLAAALPSNPGRDMYLNDLGENVSDKYPVTKVAQLIQAGAVWVDWCGWPFYDYGSTAVQELMSLLGVSTSTVDFNMKDVGGTNPATTFERSLILPSTLVAPAIVNTAAPHGTAQHLIAGMIASGQRYWYSSFAIKSGKGAYIYAYGNNSSYGLGGIGGYNTGVPISQYSPFIRSILSSLPSPSTTVSTAVPNCTQYGKFYGYGTQPGTFIFAQYFTGYYLTYVVDSACNLLGGPYRHYTSGTSTGGSGGVSPQPSSTPPSCTQYGTLVGPDSAYPGYWIFTKVSGDYKTNTVVDSSCSVKATFYFQNVSGKWVSISSIPAAGSGSKTSTPQSTSSGSNSGLIIAGAGIVGAYLLLRRMDANKRR